MTTYLMRFSLTPETWEKLVQNPEDRRDSARAYAEQVGGSLVGFWYGFGKSTGMRSSRCPTTRPWPASRLPSRRAALSPRLRPRCSSLWKRPFKGSPRGRASATESREDRRVNVMSSCVQRAHEHRSIVYRPTAPLA